MALNQVSFEIFRGEIFGLVGESGSGKTTTGRLIVKLETPDNGKLLLDGNDITKIKGRDLEKFSQEGTDDFPGSLPVSKSLFFSVR